MENQENNDSQHGLLFAFWLNLLFSIIEFIGGILTNSTAIMTDALHDFTDALSIRIAIKMEKISTKKPDNIFSYGYQRFSMLSALGMSLFLLVGGIFMILGAYRSLIHPKEIHDLGMIGLAFFGIFINGLAFLRLQNGEGHGHKHHHHHHEHHHHNQRAIMLHLLEDVLSWIAVLIGAVVIHFTKWFWIDGILTIGIALFIMYNATRNIIEIMQILLQRIPKHIDFKALRHDITNIESVDKIDHLHVWSLDGDEAVGTVQVITKNNVTHEENELLYEVTELMEKYHIQHSTVQIQKGEYTKPSSSQ